MDPPSKGAKPIGQSYNTERGRPLALDPYLSLVGVVALTMGVQAL